MKISILRQICANLHLLQTLVHNDSSEESWWRGCKYDRDEPLGCTQHKFMHEDHEILVDECICKDDLCNEAMGPIPSPSTTPKTTTPKGTKCYPNDNMLGFLYYLIIYL